MSGPKIGRAGTSYAQKPIQRLQGFFSEESKLFPSHRNFDNDSVISSIIIVIDNGHSAIAYCEGGVHDEI